MALSFNCVFEVTEQIVPKLCLMSLWEGGVVHSRLYSSSLSILSYWSHLLLRKIARLVLYGSNFKLTFICRITQLGSQILAKTAVAVAILSPVNLLSANTLSVTFRR